MTDQDKPNPLRDGELDDMSGGGNPGVTEELYGAYNVIVPGKTGQLTRYIGETEKNVWKAPAGVMQADKIKR